MNRIPNPTIILSSKYNIKTIKDLKDDEGNDLFGQIDPNITEIRITDGVSKEVREKTWMHELLHGIFRELNLRMTENDLDTLSNVLYDTFTRNKINFGQ